MSSDHHHHLYPLTSLQIGDIKTNLSKAFLYFTSDRKKFLILVDNQSWRKIKHSKSTHIKAFVTTNYRASPFINTRPTIQRTSSVHFELRSLFNWFPYTIGRALHGFIVFEVSWESVRGINYLNELQTDGSIAFEVKSLTKWEFNGIDQALRSMPLWFLESSSETQRLRTELIDLQSKLTSQSVDRNNVSRDDETFYSETDPIEQDPSSDCVDFGPVRYEEILLLCMFDNKDLPFELKPIITSNQRLLTLLESGLPSWVIFLQSYPIFCALYRPWMRPVFRILYILISLVTVVIGFYDLYKNIPLLKSALSHLRGPLFKWIESWDMISRIRYLGTMLFLQNLEMTVKAFLKTTRRLKLLASLVTETLAYPFEIVADFFMPTWSFLSETLLVVVDFIRTVVDNLDDFIIAPFEFVYSHLSSLGTLLYPILSCIWELVLVATQGCLMLGSFLSSIVSEVYEVLENCFGFVINGICQLVYLVRENPSSSDFSYLHSLWKDLFSQVFRSLRSVISVLYAFVASLKRHRLSIYNYLGSFFQRLHKQPVRSSVTKCSCHKEPQLDSHIKAGDKECEHCKKVS